MTKDKQKILVIGCINPMSAARAYLNAIKENTDIPVLFEFYAEGGYQGGLKYDSIIVDELVKELESQTITDEKTKPLQPTNPNFAKESWRKKK
ncbi:hypothetical protein KLEP7_gp42 [Pseudaeromonas phage vB_PpeM_ KLEP7]|nr:hypothetical protein KLEP7_gp42 [Pseudaeromonas phage vB_PpeM_ KLEP7]